MQKIDHNYFSLGARESFSVCVHAYGRVNVMASVIKSVSTELSSGLMLPYLQEYTLFLISLISAQLKAFHPIYNLIHQYPSEKKVLTAPLFCCLGKWLHSSLAYSTLRN